METGQQFMMQSIEIIQKNNSLNINFKRMSIQINLDGLSFCIFNPVLECIESIYNLPLKNTTTPTIMQEEIRTFLRSERELRQDFDTIKVIHNNPIFAFVPKPLFGSHNLDSYLKFCTQTHTNDVINHDTIENLNSINVYIPNFAVNQILRETYGVFEYEHFCTTLLRILFSHNFHLKDAIYAHFEANSFHLVIFKNQKMVFFNQFTFDNEMDMLYYLLFSLEQQEIDTEIIPIYLLGDIIRNSEAYRLIYNYIRHISFLPPQKNHPFCQNMDVSLARQNFILTHTF